MALTPIARFAGIPHQNPGHYVTVVAHSLVGIDRVIFQLQADDGTIHTKSVRSQARNPSDGTVGYLYHPVKPGYLTAVATGKDGGTRGLGPFRIDPARWKTIPVEPGESIVAALRRAGDGQAIRLMPGTHTYDGDWSAETLTSTRYITIEGDGQATLLGPAKGSLCAPFIKFSGLTIKAPNLVNQKGSDLGRRSVWFHRCTLVGDGSKGHPVGQNWLGPVHYTETTIQDMYRAVGLSNYDKENSVNRNVTIRNVREDCFQNHPFGLNITVVGSDPGTSGDHADIVQGWGGSYNNWLWQNVDVTAARYQGFFLRSMGTSRGCAIVNCTVRYKSPVRGGAGSAFTGAWDHLLIDGCRFTGMNEADLNTRADLMFWGENGATFTATNSAIRNTASESTTAFGGLPPGFVGPGCSLGRTSGI